MFSARSDFRNLSRAGVAENSSRTSTRVPPLSAAGRTASLAPRSTTISCAAAASRGREAMARCAMAPMEGSASPRKPSVAMLKRSSSASLEVACRSTARVRSAALMPPPLSVTRISEIPPAAVTTSMSVAPAVERVLDQLLHHARRPLDHLAGGDAVDGLGPELADGHVRFTRHPGRSDASQRRAALRSGTSGGMRFDSHDEVPDSLACGSASGMTGGSSCPVTPSASPQRARA